MVQVQIPVKSQLTDTYPLNLNNLLYHLQLYLKSWINTILYERNLYPSTSFHKRQVFELEVWASRHPGVNEWTKGLINGIFEILERVKVISIRVYEVDEKKHTEKTLEIYHLNLSEFLHVSIYDQSRLNQEIGDGELTWDDVLVDLRSSLYSFMLKIRSLPKVDKVHKFSFNVESDVNLSQDWILDKSRGSQRGDDKGTGYERKAHDQNVKSIPVAPIDVGPMIVFPLIQIISDKTG